MGVSTRRPCLRIASRCAPHLGIGLITPPVGPTLFVGCAIGKVTMEQVSKELWPFYGAMCLALAIVTYVPALSLWLPRTFGL